MTKEPLSLSLSLLRVYVLYDIDPAYSGSIRVFGTVRIINTASYLYYSQWDLSSGVPINTWAYVYSLPVFGTYPWREFYEA